MTSYRILALSLLAAVQGCSMLSGLGGGAEPEVAPPAPLRIAQIGNGPSAQFVVCDHNCPQRTPKTLLVPPPSTRPAPPPPPKMVPAVPAKTTSSVMFPFGKATLRPESTQAMEQILEEARTAKRILITGYTDSIGSRKNNGKLAQKRAKTVKAFLLKGGVKAEIIEIAKGKCCYIGDNATETGRAQNRRASIEIYFTTEEKK